MYPHDRARERKEEGEQPFRDAKEALSEQEAELRRTASPDQGPGEEESEEERTARQEAEASARLERIGSDVAESKDQP